MEHPARPVQRLPGCAKLRAQKRGRASRKGRFENGAAPLGRERTD